jgi:small subunit ribosomal protein S9
MAEEKPANETAEKTPAETPAPADEQQTPAEGATPEVTVGQGTATATAEPAERPAPALPAGKHWIWGTGRRKSAVARVRIRPGEGKIVINKRELDNYFLEDKDRTSAVAPLVASRMIKSWDVFVNVKGGGITGQADAVKLGLARALVKADASLLGALRDGGLLTRDARRVERKKYGKAGARRSFQFSKR